jgi:hypothetical protein
MNPARTLGLCMLLAASGVHAQATADLTLTPATPTEISGTNAVSAIVVIDNGSSVSTLPLSEVTFAAGKATLSAAQVDALIAATTAAGVRGATLDLTDSGHNLVKRYRIPVAAASVGGGAGGAGGAGGTAGTAGTGTKKATMNDCDAAAAAWKASDADWKSGSTALVLFTATGQYCPDRSTRIVRQGDDIFVGIVSRDDDKVDKVEVQFNPCEAEDAEPSIYISAKVPSQFAPQAGAPTAKVNIYDVRRCYNATTQITASITPAPGITAISAQRALNLNARYRGTLQIGAIYTDLHENEFALREDAGQQFIFNKEAENKGPEWVANVLVYGLPRYLTGDGWKGGYKGRDILNDYEWQDRLGLIFSAGLDDPGDRFGVGLSFEIAYGINVFWTKHWFRQRELVGVAVGDAFEGSADTLPTQHHWESDNAFGISFDLGYLTALFDRQ